MASGKPKRGERWIKDARHRAAAVEIPIVKL